MTPEIQDFKTWEEAQVWLARHGWGLGLIEQQKVLWDEANAPAKIEAAPKTVAKTVKPVAKATE